MCNHNYDSSNKDLLQLNDFSEDTSVAESHGFNIMF